MQSPVECRRRPLAGVRIGRMIDTKHPGRVTSAFEIGRKPILVLIYRGPWSRRVSRIRPNGRAAGRRAFFDRTRMSCRKTPRNPWTRRNAPGATDGVCFLLVIFSLHKQRKVTRSRQRAKPRANDRPFRQPSQQMDSNQSLAGPLPAARDDIRHSKCPQPWHSANTSVRNARFGSGHPCKPSGSRWPICQYGTDSPTVTDITQAAG